MSDLFDISGVTRQGQDLVRNNPAGFGIGTLIFFLIIGIVIYEYKRKKYEEKNPVFKRLTHFGKDTEMISGTLIPPGDSDSEMTFTMWIYVDNLIYKYGEEKNILTKGNPGSGSGQQCPGVYIDPKMNDLLIKFTLKNNKLKHVKVKDFPVRKWFLLSIVIQGFQVDIYMDGDLLFSKYLDASIKFNTGNLYLCQNGGFHGRISCIQYFPRAVYPKLLRSKFKSGPACVPWYQKVWENVFGSLKDLLANFDIQVDVEFDPDEPEYEENNNQMCEGETIKDLGAVSLEEAQQACNQDQKCDCITYMKYSYGLLPEGNMRLVNNYLAGDRTTKEDNFTAYTVKRGLFSDLTNTVSNYFPTTEE